jgi:3-deoxy-D-manno-octulosonic-acid transferase
MYFLYTVLYILACLLFVPYEYLKRPRDIRARWLKERLAIVSTQDRPFIWVHAVSVGEVNASTPLIRQLLKKMPSCRILLTTVTDTGQSVARRIFGDRIYVRYVPFDIGILLKRFISAWNIKALIIMETELWPNMIATAKRCSIPLLLVNGRLSEGAFKGYRKIKAFMHRLLGQLDYICAQNETYRDRFLTLGADPKRTIVTGNLKFDLSIESAIPEWTRYLKGKVVLAGSTHEPEEEIIIQAFEQCLWLYPNAVLVLAPRHPERFGHIERLLLKKGLAYVKRSDIDKSDTVAGFNYVLFDTVGELSLAYAACDIAIIGGSFIPHGGQNPLEPAYWGKPIICGPYMYNFPFIEEFYKAGGAVKANDANLSEVLSRFLSDKDLATKTGNIARSLIDAHRGATEKTMAVLRQTFDEKGKIPHPHGRAE